ncbi:hypothetical protein HIM_12167 [Hirsutella minnesotensis 3608]|uniref:NACHT domain-containing protein n=1 Tax=Hirsutella minnesotensis 3608 TaxID=1043627 RepID=A0A0F7ZW67_9HYPO|nr:hypothetical protein HIM_12167 [Hirsutella minnesotensis 3608]
MAGWSSNKYALVDLPELQDRLKGVLFLGTPHHGSPFTRFGLLVARLLTPLDADVEIMRPLVAGNVDLKDLDDRFREHFGNTTRLYYRERRKMRRYLLGFIPWIREFVVPESSATAGASFLQIIALDADHRGLNRFRSRADNNYQQVASKLVKILSEKSRPLPDGKLLPGSKIGIQGTSQNAETDKALLWDLRVVDPKDDMKKIENKKDALLESTYEWIFDTEQYAGFTRWGDDGHDPDPSRLLWIKGHAGTGKTMLLIGIIRELESKPDSLAPRLSYFFCQGTDSTLNNATAALRSLIWMLLVQQPYLIKYLRKKYNDSGTALFRDSNAFFALRGAFWDMLKDPELSPVLFVVDALDECDRTNPGLNELIDLISVSISRTAKVKWIVSSRPEVAVQAKLRNPVISKALIELDAQTLEAPVNAYIDHKLRALEGR